MIVTVDRTASGRLVAEFSPQSPSLSRMTTQAFSMLPVVLTSSSLSTSSLLERIDIKSETVDCHDDGDDADMVAAGRMAIMVHAAHTFHAAVGGRGEQISTWNIMSGGGVILNPMFLKSQEREENEGKSLLFFLFVVGQIETWRAMAEGGIGNSNF
jgi:hypothetical protein